MPFIYFAGQASHVHPLGGLDRRRLPAFALVAPDLCNDAHDCRIATADRWLVTWLGMAPRVALVRMLVAPANFSEGLVFESSRTFHSASPASQRPALRPTRGSGLGAATVNPPDCIALPPVADGACVHAVEIAARAISRTPRGAIHRGNHGERGMNDSL